MEEEEIVISSWQRSDFPKGPNDSFSRTIKRNSSKENIDMNPWLSEQDNKNASLKMKSEDDEIMIDDDTLSRLIEGDLKSDEESESFHRLRKPKPRPRHEARHSNTENEQERADKLFSDRKDKAAVNLLSSGKDFADKLFSGAKDKADKLFSGQNGSAEKLFSGGKDRKVKGKSDDDTPTSPRPVPRPRSKPRAKDGENEEPKTLAETTDSEKVTADQLFESMGKSSKSVSFSDVQASKDSKKKDVGSVEKKSGNDKNSKNERIPPKKAPRSPRNNTLNSGSPRKEKSSGDTEQRTSEHKKHPQPPQRHHDRNISESNSSVAGYNSGSFKSDGMELFHSRNSKDVQHQEKLSARGVKQAMRDDAMSEGWRNEGRTPRQGETLRQESGPLRWEQQEQENYGLGRNGEGHSREIWRGKYEKSHKSNSKNGHDRKENITDMFEDHVPANNGIILDDEEGRTNQHGWHRQGMENRGRSPMKAHKTLDEMTKSPDLYNFKYESRDSPQNDTIARGKSSSLTDLSNWKNTEFDHDEDGLDSSRSGFTSSRGIRDAVYAEWLQKKQGKLKEAARKKVEEKKKEEKKIKEKQEKEILAKKAFEAWSSQKEEVIKTGIKKKKEIKNKELDVQREKIVKKQDAKKYFESWKSKKDEILKESYKEKKEEEREKKQKKIEDHKEKIDIATRAFDKWKSQKDEKLKEEARSTRQSEKLKTKYEKEAEMEKRQECEKTFQEFLRKKGTSKRTPPSPSLTQRAWCPGGLTRGTNLIPDKVQPVIAPPTLNRSRSFSGTTRAMMSFNGTKRLSRGW